MDFSSPNLPFPDAGQADTGRRWLETLLGALDARLRRRNGVFEYSERRDCVFRIQLAPSPGGATLGDGTTLQAGMPVIILHWWNEQIPRVPAEGPTLGWARRLDRAVDASLCELERYLAKTPALREVSAICVVLGLAVAARNDHVVRVMTRYGFERMVMPPLRRLGEWLHRLGENVLISLMVLGRNPMALHADSLHRDRVVMCQSRRDLQQRYGVDRHYQGRHVEPRQP